MAQTATLTSSNRQGLTVYKIVWLTDASGDVALGIDLRRGRLLQIKTVPDGTDVPTAAYDLTLLDPSDSGDVLEGKGGDLSATLTVWAAGAVQVFLEGGSYTFTIANGGNAKRGIVYLFVQ